MLLSEAFEFLFRGKAATLTVVRNDGFCYGVIDFKDRRRHPLDVMTAKDWYDQADEDAAEGLMRAARRPQNVIRSVRFGRLTRRAGC